MKTLMRQVLQQLLRRESGPRLDQGEPSSQQPRNRRCIPTALLQRRQPCTGFTFRQLLAILIAQQRHVLETGWALPECREHTQLRRQGLPQILTTYHVGDCLLYTSPSPRD